jgi:CheY-like chemotaxis protein
VDPEPAKKTGKKLMIVDDDAEMRTLLAEYFRRLGYEVTEKESGQTALQASNNDRFDCFILDVSMPEMTGVELLKKLRERGITAPAITWRSLSARVNSSIASPRCCDVVNFQRCRATKIVWKSAIS